MSADGHERSRVVVRDGYRLEHATGSAHALESAVAIDATAVLVLSGAVELRLGETQRALTAPVVGLVNPGSALGIGSASGAERLVVSFRPETLNDAAERAGLGDDGVVLFRREVTALTEAVDASARRVLSELWSPSAGPVLDLAVALLSVDLVREAGHVHRESRLEWSRAGLVDRRIRRSVEFMHDNYARDLPLGEIAAAVYVSEYHFARLFKRITGATPHAYLATIRIEHARRLLAATDLSVTEIAERVGYQSASHFGRVFRQLAGATPTAYRDAAMR